MDGFRTSLGEWPTYDINPYPQSPLRIAINQPFLLCVLRDLRGKSLPSYLPKPNKRAMITSYRTDLPRPVLLHFTRVSFRPERVPTRSHSWIIPTQIVPFTASPRLRSETLRDTMGQTRPTASPQGNSQHSRTSSPRPPWPAPPEWLTSAAPPSTAG